MIYLNVKYRLSEVNYASFIKYTYLFMNSGKILLKKRIRINSILIFILIDFLAILLNSLFFSNTLFIIYILPFLFLFPLYLLKARFFRRYVLNKTIVRSIKLRRQSKVVNENVLVDITVNEVGLIDDDNNGKITSYKWDAFIHITTYNGCILLYFNELSAVIIPSTCFDSNNEFQEFFQYCNTFILNNN